MKLVKDLFDMVKVSYAREFDTVVASGTGWGAIRDKRVTCLIAVAWVLESRGVSLQYHYNDYLPCFSIKNVYYDLTKPYGTSEVKNLKHGGNIDYRASELFIVYDNYLSRNYEAVDFINAFSISNQGAIFPYDPDEV